MATDVAGPVSGALLLCCALLLGPALWDHPLCLAQQVVGRAGQLEFEAKQDGDATQVDSKLLAGGSNRQRILAITATYPRAFQEMYFTRLAATIRIVAPPFLWIVVESPFKTLETAAVLENTAGLCLPLGSPDCKKVDYVHLETGRNETAKINRGVGHRNRGLRFIEEGRLEGIVYIMDDDNTYTWQLFEEFRKMKRVGILPVSYMKFDDEHLEGGKGWEYLIVERALVKPKNESTSELGVYGWQTAFWCSPRPAFPVTRVFNVDMGSFAFRSDMMWGPINAKGYPRQPVRFHPAQAGYLETYFLQDLVHDPSEVEILADGATDVWAWHIHADAKKGSAYPKYWWVAQPTDLVPIEFDVNSSWPFLINDQRYGIKGKGEEGKLFVYS